MASFLWGKLGLHAGWFASASVTFNPHPFAEGTSKQSHEGFYFTREKHGKYAVVKKLKNGSSYISDFSGDIKAHKLAKQFADKWNSLNYSNKYLSVQIPIITQIKQIQKTNNLFNKLFINNRDIHKSGEYVTVEDYLFGKFDKYNSNTGWHNNDKLSKSINAFSHWTYHISNGKYLICDLQGVYNDKNNQFDLTDPAVMCDENNHSGSSGHVHKFGLTDLGVVGISNWFYHHKCNELCDPRWLKPDIIAKSDDISPESATSYQLADVSDLDV